MINLKEEIKLMDGDGDATLTLSLYQLECVQAKVEELERVNENHCKAHLMSIDKIDELTGAIKKWLDGDYPNPRRNRPRDCMHGVGYWQSCENCETEYWESVLKQEVSDADT